MKKCKMRGILRGRWREENRKKGRNEGDLP